MTTWADLTAELTLLLDDAGASSYAEQLRVSSFNRACETFATTHTAPFKSFTAQPSAMDAGSSVSLPADCIQVGGVKRNSAWLRPNLLIPGEDEDTNGYVMVGNAVYFPDADLNDVTVWYYALYPPIANGASIVSLPKWAEWPVLNLTIAYLLTPSAVGVADLRRWATKRDAGQLEENPSRAQQQFHIQQYQAGIIRVKQQDREMLFRVIR